MLVVDAGNNDAVDLDHDAFGLEPDEGFGLPGNQEPGRFLAAQRTFAVANPGVNLRADSRVGGRNRNRDVADLEVSEFVNVRSDAQAVCRHA